MESSHWLLSNYDLSILQWDCIQLKDVPQYKQEKFKGFKQFNIYIGTVKIKFLEETETYLRKKMVKIKF